MLVKQVLIDLGVILLVPVILIGGYMIWGSNGVDVALLSGSPNANLSPDQPGAKTKLALDTLSGISLSDALFKDEAYTSLTTFTVTIPEVPLSRDYPFTPPPVVEEMLRQARLGNNAANISAGAQSANNPTLTKRIDDLKKSLGGK